jgi:hypothetical protein
LRNDRTTSDLHLDYDTSVGRPETYQISASLPPVKPGDPTFPVAGSFRVEAFRPAEFEVHLKAESESIFFGREYAAEVRANYLFGGVMSGQPVSWRLRLNRTSYSPPGFKGYIFGNELDWGDEETEETSRLAASGEANLDAEGKLAIRLPVAAVKNGLGRKSSGDRRRQPEGDLQPDSDSGPPGRVLYRLRPSIIPEERRSLSFDVVAVDPQETLLPIRRSR